MSFKYLYFVITISIWAHLVLGDKYDNLIAASDIYYYSPIPNSRTPTLLMRSLKEFKPQGKIKIVIHGFKVGKDSEVVAPIKHAYLSRGEENLFMADWSAAAAVPYSKARFFVNRVGVHFGKIIKNFTKVNSIRPQQIHLIGHSLGAHIAGNIGRFFGGSIGRITGLDPAYPLFTNESKDDLQPETAKFVDVIHTACPILGDFTPRGHADFYPNYGLIAQPGCGPLDLITIGSCSHYRAPLFYAESVQLPYNFPAISCPLENILEKNVESCLLNQNKVIGMMGAGVSKKTSGFFFLETHYISPYGLGVFSKI